MNLMILDKPYVSMLMSQTLKNMDVNVIKCGDIRIPLEKSLNIHPLEKTMDLVADTQLTVLCNSEYAVASIYPYLKGTPVLEQADLFKNKVKFREMLRHHYPDFFFRECAYEELLQLRTSSLTFPIVIKPTKGFRSVGVYLVEKEEDWMSICEQIQQDMEAAKEIYPEFVVSASSFILEEWIRGDEFAIDAYFDDQGEPVVLNVYKRMFAHEADTSDRIYYTGKSVMQETLTKVEEFMRILGKATNLRRFPMHFEVRITPDGRLIPIEVNPLRFAGLCTTDLGAHSYGVNVYEYFFEQKKPDWNTIIETLDDRIFSFLCAELPLSIEGRSIESVHDRRFVKNFSDVLEYRLVPYEEYPTFSVVFYQSESLEENKHLLELDLEQYLIMK